MKTIGVLGGLGPQATMDFESRVHTVAQRLIPPSGNGGYPPMVAYYYRFVPFIATEDGSRVLPLRPDPRLVDAAAKIGGMADFISAGQSSTTRTLVVRSSVQIVPLPKAGRIRTRSLPHITVASTM